MDLRANTLVRRLVALALDEDLGLGDVTVECTIEEGCSGVGEIHAKEPLTVCGLGIIEVIKEQGNFHFESQLKFAEGQTVEAGAVLATISGNAGHILSAERTILNLLQRLCGVATYTRALISQAGGMTILDTRKTMPGWRALDKYAVRVGGGRNHRMSLSDMVLLKNNHIDLYKGDIHGIFSRIRARKPWYVPVQCEVRTFAEFEAALSENPDSIMLDNMSNDEILRCITRVKSMVVAPAIEVSGGVSCDRLPVLRSLGATVVSLGALRTRAHNLDIAMRFSTNA